MEKTKTAKPKMVIAGNPTPNKGLPLENIDYSNLNGEAFKNYMEIVNGLLLNTKYDWEMWKASSEQKKRFNEDTGKVDDYIAGIKLNGNKPIQTTRITLRDALQLNAQVSHNQADAGNSKYLLLAKPKSE